MMLTEILNFVAAATPFMIASYDAGYNFFFNGPAAQQYMESFIISKESK